MARKAQAKAPKLSAEQQEAIDALGSEKRVAFVLAYVGEAMWNGAAAARIAGYSEDTAKTTASELLTFPDVAYAIELFKKPARDKAIMGKREAQRLLTGIARAAETDTVMSKDGPIDVRPSHNTRMSAVKTLGDLRGWVTRKLDANVTIGVPKDKSAARAQAEQVVAALDGRIVWNEEPDEEGGEDE